MTSCKPPPTCIDASPIPDANDSRMSAIPYEANLTPMGNRPPFLNQEAVGCDAKRRVVMEPAPAAPLIVPQSEFLLELLVVALDAPAQLGQRDEAVEGDVLGKGGEPVFRRPLLLRRPLDQQPFLRAGFAKMIVAMRRPHSQTRKARGERVGRALPPRDRGPRVCRQRERDLLG